MTIRKLRIALAASLLTNLFAIGALGGGLVMLDRMRTPLDQSAPVRRPIRSAAVKLPASDRARFEAIIQKVIDDGLSLRKTAVGSRRTAAGLFAAPNFDPAATSKLLSAARAADIELQGRLDNAAIEFATTLPLAERATLGVGLAQGGPLRHPDK